MESSSSRRHLDSAVHIDVLQTQQSAFCEGGDLIHEGDKVRFYVTDIFLPTRDDLPNALTTTQEIEGIVADISDAGLQPRAFAVVQVMAPQNVVVPIDKLAILNEPVVHHAP